MAELIKIDRNGSKHYRGMVECDRCQGRGLFATGTCNGELVISHVDNGVCWKCHGVGKVLKKWIERTPEYQAKLDAKREAREAAKREAWEKELRETEAAREEAERRAEEERKAEEERIKAQKAISQFVGEVKERITVAGIYDHSAWFTITDPFGRPETRYVHTFRDENGNVLVWKTGCGLRCGLEEGSKVTITGTVKDHTVYKDEKQTNLLRVKIKEETA